MVVRHLARDPMLFKKRHVLGIDNAALVGALVKGRSSCDQLNKHLQRISALLLASGTYLSIPFLPSRMNPADRDSRPNLRTADEFRRH